MANPYFLAVHPKVPEVYTIEREAGLWKVSQYIQKRSYHLGFHGEPLRCLGRAESDAREPLEWSAVDGPGLPETPDSVLDAMMDLIGM